MILFSINDVLQSVRRKCSFFPPGRVSGHIFGAFWVQSRQLLNRQTHQRSIRSFMAPGAPLERLKIGLADRPCVGKKTKKKNNVFCLACFFVPSVIVSSFHLVTLSYRGQGIISGALSTQDFSFSYSGSPRLGFLGSLRYSKTIFSPAPPVLFLSLSLSPFLSNSVYSTVEARGNKSKERRP